MNAETVLTYLSGNPVAVGATLVALLSILQTTLLTFRLNTLLKGGDGKSLEKSITNLGERAQKLETHAQATSSTLKNHDNRITRSIQGVSVKRFDPFQNAGGQQSFATALLNEAGDGVVVSGIHARDGVRVYSKEVKGFKSERELSEEEQGAIEEAKRGLLS